MSAELLGVKALSLRKPVLTEFFLIPSRTLTISGRRYQMFKMPWLLARYLRCLNKLKALPLSPEAEYSTLLSDHLISILYISLGKKFPLTYIVKVFQNIANISV